MGQAHRNRSQCIASESSRGISYYVLGGCVNKQGGLPQCRRKGISERNGLHQGMQDRERNIAV